MSFDTLYNNIFIKIISNKFYLPDICSLFRPRCKLSESVWRREYLEAVRLSENGEEQLCGNNGTERPSFIDRLVFGEHVWDCDIDVENLPSDEALLDSCASGNIATTFGIDLLKYLLIPATLTC